MRIISGKAKSIRLKAPPEKHTRPVLDQVKESVFNILGPLDGLVVLDLFAGSGSVGLEAASRGAEITYLVENQPIVLRILKENIQKTGLVQQTKVVKAHLPFGLRLVPKQKFDLIFVDPPYYQNLVGPTLKELLKYQMVKNESQVIVEHATKESFDLADFQIERTKKYGQTSVSFLTL